MKSYPKLSQVSQSLNLYYTEGENTSQANGKAIGDNAVTRK